MGSFSIWHWLIVLLIVVNTGAEGGPEVHHLHVHVMGGPRPWLKG